MRNGRVIISFNLQELSQYINEDPIITKIANDVQCFIFSRAPVLKFHAHSEGTFCGIIFTCIHTNGIVLQMGCYTKRNSLKFTLPDYCTVLAYVMICSIFYCVIYPVGSIV